MSYSIKRAALIAEQLERLATQNAHQLAGQHSNLDFWIAEAVDAIRVIDEYTARFRRLLDAQVAWVKAHGTKVTGYCHICGGACELGPQTPEPPLRIRSEDLTEARTALQRAARGYLLRLYRARLIEKEAVRLDCQRMDVGVEEEDFRRAESPSEDIVARPDLVPDSSRKR